MSRGSIFTVVGVLGVFAGSPARADQCAVVDKDASAWALKVVTRGASVSQFCEACGDTTPGAATVVTSVIASKDDGQSMRIAINGKKVDLAYTYLQTGKSTWTNVGLMVGCGASDVTPVVTKSAAVKLEKPADVASFAICEEYVRIVTKLTDCKNFPKEARDTMKQGMDAMRQSWEQLRNGSPETKKAMGDACRTATDAIKKAAQSMKCSI